MSVDKNQNPLDPITVVTEWQQHMYSLAHQMLGNDADAADATQEIFIRVLERLSQYSPTGSFKAWMYQLGTNVVLNYIRDNRLRKTREETAAMETKTNGNDYRPEEKELEAALRAHLADLPEDWRAALVLHYYHGLTQVEAATVLNVPRSTLQSRLQKGLESLQAGLKQFGFITAVPAMEYAMQNAAPLQVPTQVGSALMAQTAKATAGKVAVAAITFGGLVMTKKLIIAVAVLVFLITVVGSGIIGPGIIKKKPIADDSIGKTTGDNERHRNLPIMSDRDKSPARATENQQESHHKPSAGPIHPSRQPVVAKPDKNGSKPVSAGAYSLSGIVIYDKDRTPIEGAIVSLHPKFRLPGKAISQVTGDQEGNYYLNLLERDRTPTTMSSPSDDILPAKAKLQCVTDKNGRFHIGGLAAGTCYIFVDKDGYCISNLMIGSGKKLIVDNHIEDYEILVRQVGGIVGHICYPEEQALPAAILDIGMFHYYKEPPNDQGPVIQSRISVRSDGTFYFPVEEFCFGIDKRSVAGPNGSVVCQVWEREISAGPLEETLFIEHPDYQPLEVHVSFAHKMEVVNVGTLYLQAGSRFFGSVKDDAGQPIKDVYFEVGGSSKWCYSNAEGKFLINGMDCDTSCVIEHDDYVPQVINIIYNQHMDIVLDRGENISGRFLTPQGEPISGAEISACFRMPNSKKNYERWTKTDKEGRYRIQGLFPGNAIVQISNTPGFIHYYFDNPDEAEKTVATGSKQVNFTANMTNKLQLIFKDSENGKLIKSDSPDFRLFIDLQTTSKGDICLIFKPDPESWFVPLKPGEHLLNVRWPGYKHKNVEVSVTVEPANQKWEVILEKEELE
ncbi:sigma-70 family RNA polymerase sigma factor [Planctomycetota bacterium]